MDETLSEVGEEMEVGNTPDLGGKIGHSRSRHPWDPLGKTWNYP